MVFEVTPRLQKAVEISNELADGQLKSLFSKIMDKFHAKEDAFTAAQKQQMADNFELSVADVQLLLETILFIVQTAAHHKLSAKALAKHLTSIGLGEEKVIVVATLWKTKGADIIKTLLSAGFYSTQLEDLVWAVDVEVANSKQGQTAAPNAKLQMSLSDDSSFTVSMDQDQLAAFYTKLEQIQSQLDALS